MTKDCGDIDWEYQKKLHEMVVSLMVALFKYCQNNGIAWEGATYDASKRIRDILGFVD